MDFEKLYRERFRDVYLYLRSLGARPPLAEEIAQETFSKAMKAIGRFDGREDIRAWLFVIARNSLYSHYRKAKRIEPLDQTEPKALQADIAQQLSDKEQARTAHRLLHEMREPYKEVLTLRIFGELPFEQIGSLFGRSDSWARVTYHRGRNMLIAKMKEVENG